MASNTVIALFAAIGVGIFVYRKTSYRGTGDFKKQVAPAAISAVLTFLVALTALWAVFG